MGAFTVSSSYVNSREFNIYPSLQLQSPLRKELNIEEVYFAITFSGFITLTPLHCPVMWSYCKKRELNKKYICTVCVIIFVFWRNVCMRKNVVWIPIEVMDICICGTNRWITSYALVVTPKIIQNKFAFRVQNEYGISIILNCTFRTK